MNASLREIVRYAVREAKAKGVTPKAWLEALHSAIGQNSEDGRIVVSTSEAGGSVTFQVSESALSGAGLDNIGDAIDYLDSLDDPNTPDPVLPRGIKRLKVSFRRATI